jgi:hypothetical protein
MVGAMLAAGVPLQQVIENLVPLAPPGMLIGWQAPWVVGLLPVVFNAPPATGQFSALQVCQAMSAAGYSSAQMVAGLSTFCTAGAANEWWAQPSTVIDPPWGLSATAQAIGSALQAAGRSSEEVVASCFTLFGPTSAPSPQFAFDRNSSYAAAMLSCYGTPEPGGLTGPMFTWQQVNEALRSKSAWTATQASLGCNMVYGMPEV